MRFSTAVAATAAFVAGANAWGNYTGPVYTTEVVTAYTTYCPEATQITHGGVTYTVTEATTLTITNCPCTITKPVSSVVVTTCTSTPVPVYTSVAPVSSAVYTPAPYVNATSAAPTKATGTGAYTAPIATFTGAANKAFAASGAGLAAVFGLAAYIL
ncbi:hypothetical protein K432DRAFT_306624 [Lepidopterella palustris CBS 459.81]|uniref:Clock-controlled protein 6 n=1 Tax=Lepidopterella palustris CBS 459.81 TaxID=1314670 RepID=A0A8E2JBG2_9PEZI|nr:hypothetical protein K432DRAFT_306624 [Lepidopterella palustris CBS 459.81]